MIKSKHIHGKLDKNNYSTPQQQRGGISRKGKQSEPLITIEAFVSSNLIVRRRIVGGCCTWIFRSNQPPSCDRRIFSWLVAWVGLHNQLEVTLSHHSGMADLAPSKRCLELCLSGYILISFYLFTKSVGWFLVSSTGKQLPFLIR